VGVQSADAHEDMIDGDVVGVDPGMIEESE
jgi:hypothetical protein